MEQVTRAQAAYKRADQARELALTQLHAAIVTALRSGGRGTQAEIARRTGYTRERIRQIARAAGLEA